jgi:antirestriction protein ArdC
MTYKSNQRADVYSQVTDRIVTAIEAGQGTFQMPWHRSSFASHRPQNVATGAHYRGVNVISLWASAELTGFSSGLWGTYRQWQSVGAQVRKGEKSSLVVFYKELQGDHTPETDDDGENGRKRFVAKASYVFNADQVEGYTLPAVPAPANPAEAIAHADAYIRATGAVINHGGERAYYDRVADAIQVPERGRFLGTETSSPTESYYSTLLHELTHWTGASNRCDRQFGKRFGDNAYAMEELVAELGAAFLCAELGISLEPRADHAAYLDHWLEVMKADKKAIFTAASQAAKAADYLGNLQPRETEAAA